MKIILGLVAVVVLASYLSPAYSFDVNSFNMTLEESQIISESDYDLFMATFSLFNFGAEQVVFSGHNMLYLNDTSGIYWEYSSYMDLENYSSTDCPELDSYVLPGTSTNVKLCYVISNSTTEGYSLILNNNRYMMDWQTNEFVLESVPDWFSTTANAWCSDVIPDADYFNSIQYNIEQGTIKVLRTESGVDVGTLIPDWVKTNACDWSNDLISDYEFLNGTYWLIDNGKIQLN